MGSQDDYSEVRNGQTRRGGTPQQRRTPNPQQRRATNTPRRTQWAPIVVPPPSAAWRARQGQQDNRNERADGYETETQSNGFGGYGNSHLKPSAVGNARRMAFEREYGAQDPGYAPGYNPDNGGGGGGGYGGGGSSAADKAAKLAALDKLMATMTGAVSADQKVATDRFAELDLYMQGLENPYASIGPAQEAQVQSDDLSNLLMSQAGDDAGLRAQAQFLQAQNGASAGASDRRAAMLRAAQAAWNQSSRTSGQLAGQQVQGDLASQLLAMKAAIESQKVAMA